MNVKKIIIIHILVSFANVGFGFDQHFHHFGVPQGSSAQNQALILHNAIDANALCQQQTIAKTIELPYMQNQSLFYCTH